jgi:hypothetical protein
VATLFYFSDFAVTFLNSLVQTMGSVTVRLKSSLDGVIGRPPTALHRLDCSGSGLSQAVTLLTYSNASGAQFS